MEKKASKKARNQPSPAEPGEGGEAKGMLWAAIPQVFYDLFARVVPGFAGLLLLAIAVLGPEEFARNCRQVINAPPELLRSTVLALIGGCIAAYFAGMVFASFFFLVSGLVWFALRLPLRLWPGVFGLDADTARERRWSPRGPVNVFLIGDQDYATRVDRLRTHHARAARYIARMHADMFGFRVLIGASEAAILARLAIRYLTEFPLLPVLAVVLAALLVHTWVFYRLRADAVKHYAQACGVNEEGKDEDRVGP